MINYQGVSLEREHSLLLHDVSFSIAEGEFVYLIGKVGSGKSSLLKSMYAEVPIMQGDARIFEYDMRNIRRNQIPFLRRRLGIIFQDFQLLVDRTVEQNLQFVLKATGWDDQRLIKKRIDEVLRMVGMENKGYRMPNTLSGGEQQRVVIARSLLNDPKVILADEPTGNLDPETGQNIVKLLYDICHNSHTAVLMSTHNLQLLEQFPGRVFRVEEGKVTEDVIEASVGVGELNQAEAAEATETEIVEDKEEETGEKSTDLSLPKESTENNEASPVEEMPVETPVVSEPIVESQSETIVEVDVEIQSDSASDSDDSNNAEDHCSQSDIQPEERNCNGRSDQIPSESAVL